MVAYPIDKYVTTSSDFSHAGSPLWEANETHHPHFTSTTYGTRLPAHQKKTLFTSQTHPSGVGIRSVNRSLWLLNHLAAIEGSH